jgi:hypothetical protein
MYIADAPRSSPKIPLINSWYRKLRLRSDQRASSSKRREGIGAWVEWGGFGQGDFEFKRPASRVRVELATGP